MAETVRQGPWATQQGNQQQQTTEQLGGISPASWQGLEPPRREWMVDGCFMKGTVGMVSGDGNIGKSLLMQQLATCAAIGRSWIGIPLRPGRSVFFTCEDDKDELWRRQHDINRHLGCDMADLGDLDLIPRVGQDSALIDYERFTRKPLQTGLFNQLANRCQQFGAQYIFIDTATQTFRGNQMDETAVMHFVNQLRRLAIRQQGVVILTKHPSLTGRATGTGESGSVSWNNSVRSRLYMHKDKAGQLVIEGMKSNYGPNHKPIPLKWERGAFVVVEPEVRNYSEPTGYED